MIMRTEKQTVELRITIKKIINLTEKCKGKNLSDLYFKLSNELSEKGLAEIIFAFGEIEGKNAFNYDINKVYDFMDVYMRENKKTCEDIYKEIAEVINEEGFFPKKMTKEELESKLNNPMSSIDIEETMKNAVDKVMTEIAINEFKGHQS